MKMKLKKKWVVPIVLLLGVLALFSLFGGGENVSSERYHEVERGDLTISVVEGGTLEAVNEEVVKNSIDGESRVIYLIPEGSYVKEGELIAEFDRGQAESSLQEKEVQYESRQAEVVKATNDLIITKSTVESDIGEAELDVKFATMDLKKFESWKRSTRCGTLN